MINKHYIKVRLADLGMTQSALAVALGKLPNNFSAQLSSGRISLDDLENIANELKCSLDNLSTRKG